MRLALLLPLLFALGCAAPYTSTSPPVITIVSTPSTLPSEVKEDINWTELSGIDMQKDMVTIAKQELQADKENKLVLLYFYSAKDCEDCFNMTNYTFKDKNVSVTINAHYIPLKLNLDNAPELKEKLTTPPTLNCDPKLFKLPVVSVFVPFDMAGAVESHGYVPADIFNKDLDELAKYVKSPSP